MKLEKAQRKKVKLKIGIAGASGFGKTYSALLMAFGMTNDWSKIAVIDTENNSAELYSNLGEYNVLPLLPPYTPERYNGAIKVCEDANIEVIIIDSISHEWEGVGGCLEAHAALGGQFVHWAKITPRHNSFIQTILHSKCHIITTVRKKQDYDLVKNDKGKMEPVKVGLKEVTREGFEYELTVNLEIINERHLVKASKDRTNLFSDKPEFVITIETGKELMEWSQNGIDFEAIEKQKYENELIDALIEMQSAENKEQLSTIWSKHKKFQLEGKFLNLKNKLKDELQ